MFQYAFLCELRFRGREACCFLLHKKLRFEHNGYELDTGALLYCDHGKIRFFTLFAIAAGALLWQILPGKLLRIMTVSYTHLDVYKRQGLYDMIDDMQIAYRE